MEPDYAGAMAAATTATSGTLTHSSVDQVAEAAIISVSSMAMQSKPLQLTALATPASLFMHTDRGCKN